MKKLTATAILAATALAAAAQEAAGTPETALTIKSIITRGGGIMYVLVALSLVAAMLIIYYLLALREEVLCPAKFLHQAQDAAAAGDLPALRELCQKEQSAAGKILQGAWSRCQDDEDGEQGRDAMLKGLEDEGSRQVAAIWSQLQYLADVGAVAPMVGLLGTVWGMMVSFSGLESGLNMINKADRLASGVSQAMYTTFGGLVIGIAAAVAYAIFRGRLNRLSGKLEEHCGAIVRSYCQAATKGQSKR